jgi:hypothetical protein
MLSVKLNGTYYKRNWKNKHALSQYRYVPYEFKNAIHKQISILK